MECAVDRLAGVVRLVFVSIVPLPVYRLGRSKCRLLVCMYMSERLAGCRRTCGTLSRDIRFFS